MAWMASGVKTAAVTVQGRAHLDTGTPCQDQTATLRENGVSAIVLADGAGSMAHSHLGARAVVDAVAALLCREFDTLYAAPDAGATARVLAVCSEALDTLAVPPFQAGSTLLFFALRAEGYLAGHLGDGVIGLYGGGVPAVLSPPENGENRNETWFTTSADAAAHLRLYRGMLPPGGTALLMSDGAAESLYIYGEARFSPAFATLAGWMASHPEEAVRQALEQNARERLAEKTRDDIGLALLHLPGGAECGEAPDEEPGPGGIG